MAVLNDRGAEELDPTPIAINLPHVTITVMDDVRQFIRRELSQASVADGGESWEEANDFDVGDDYDVASAWEYEADQEAEDQELLRKEFGGAQLPLPGHGEKLSDVIDRPQDGISPASAAGAEPGEEQPAAQK